MIIHVLKGLEIIGVCELACLAAAGCELRKLRELRVADGAEHCLDITHGLSFRRHEARVEGLLSPFMLTESW
jgi:hypothetical protein